MKQWHERKKYKKYNFMSVDRDGDAWVYVREPKLHGRLLMWDFGGESIRAPKYDTDGRNWEDSLERRPQKPGVAMVMEVKFDKEVKKYLDNRQCHSPSWDDAPDWASYLAMDEDGRWYWYEEKPVITGDYFEKISGKFMKAGSPNWKTSLQERPK